MTARKFTKRRTESVMTLASWVTVARIVFVPVFMVALLSPWPDWFPSAPSWLTAIQPWIAALVFIILSATDGLDGHLARSRNEVTTFGKFIDPLADKILVAAALLALIELGTLPSWIALVIISRDFVVSGLRMLASLEGVVIAASWYGKAKTVTQIIAISMFLIKSSPLIIQWFGPTFDRWFYVASWVVMIAAVVLTILSMVDYFGRAREILVGPWDDSEPQEPRGD